MTTEIAVLNRLGIALAADSAVTISGGGTTKVFNSADKLFELSCFHPVALMLNGNMDCFGVPWEIIIKDFRDAHGDATQSKSILDWASEFVGFVEARPDVGGQSANNYFKYCAESELSYIRRQVSEIFWSAPENMRRQSSVNIMNYIIENVVSDRLEELEKDEVSESLKDIEISTILSAYSDELKSIIEAELSPLVPSEGLTEHISKLIAYSLRVMQPNHFSTGLIVAGYGPDDNYPSVASIDIDGYVLNKLKHSGIINRARIERPELGYAVSFAQTDVIERLLGGADPRFIKKTIEFLDDAFAKVAPPIVDIYAARAGKAKRQQEENKIREILKVIRDTYQDDTSDAFKDEFREEFERMIALMPKLELIELAEALISITAIERKATADEGTVGGPIDVAFITKHEGFVWIKRKHYFQARLNPRYFWRKYRVDNGADQ